MEIRTAVVLCAGRATRLWPVTLTRPKALVRVANKPIIHRILESLLEAGIERAVVVISPDDSSLPDYLAGQPVDGIRLDFVPQDSPRGLADATARAAAAVGDNPFLLHLGDELIEGGVADFVRDAAEAEATATVLLREVDEPRHFGVAVVEGDRIVRVVEKPAAPPSPYALVGLYVFKPAVFDAIAATPESPDTGEVEITDTIQWLIEHGAHVRPYIFERTWFDIGRFETLLAANRFYLTEEITEAPPPVGEHCTVVGYAEVSRSCTLVNCRIIGPCVIASGCKVEDSTVGPYVSLSKGCTIFGSQVADSILGEGCEVRELAGKLTESVLGDDVRVHGGGARELVRLRAADRTMLELAAPEER